MHVQLLISCWLMWWLVADAFSSDLVQAFTSRPSSSRFDYSFQLAARGKSSKSKSNSKNRNAEKKQGTRGKRADNKGTTATAIAPPSNFKRLKLSFPTPSTTLSADENHHHQDTATTTTTTSISLLEVQDPTWWDTDPQPYGGRTWPSSLGIAQFLCQHSQLVSNARVVEVACGNGMPSLLAASLGATVLATDLSPTVLKLVQEGWKECRPQHGTLTTRVVNLQKDLASVLDALNSKDDDDERLQILIASAALYEPELAQALGRCVLQAAQQNKKTWIIVGDCDSGERDGGRAIFLKLLQEANMECKWTELSLAQPQLGWRAKPVKLLHIHAPESIDLS